MIRFTNLLRYSMALPLLLCACGSDGAKSDGEGGGGRAAGGRTAGAGGSSGQGTGGSGGGGGLTGASGTNECPSLASATTDCSIDCKGNCYGTNASGTADPSNHVGDCFVIGTGNIRIYCAPWGIDDPCSHCQ